jgi:hypothetical protein
VLPAPAPAPAPAAEEIVSAEPVIEPVVEPPPPVVHAQKHAPAPRFKRKLR